VPRRGRWPAVLPAKHRNLITFGLRTASIVLIENQCEPARSPANTLSSGLAAAVLLKLMAGSPGDLDLDDRLSTRGDGRAGSRCLTFSHSSSPPERRTKRAIGACQLPPCSGLCCRASLPHRLSSWRRGVVADRSSEHGGKSKTGNELGRLARR